MNPILLTSLFAILFTQFIKYPLAMIFKKGQARISLMVSTGGMPSSHSAAVSSLITALVLEYGFYSPMVAISTIFGLIVLFDSMGVRRQSGEQGIVLEHLIAAYLENNKKKYTAQELNQYKQMIISKYLGHRPSEVIVGVITGALIAVLVRILFMKYVAFV